MTRNDTSETQASLISQNMLLDAIMSGSYLSYAAYRVRWSLMLGAALTFGYVIDNPLALAICDEWNPDTSVTVMNAEESDTPSLGASA